MRVFGAGEEAQHASTAGVDGRGLPRGVASEMPDACGVAAARPGGRGAADEWGTDTAASASSSRLG
jgi:hypothetical protein